MEDKKLLENRVIVAILCDLVEKKMVSREKFCNLLEKIGEI